MKNQKIIVFAVAVVALLLVGFGGYSFFANRASNSGEDQIGFIEDEYPVLSPEEIGLSLQVRSDKKAVKFIISKASDIESIEYDLSYEADLAGGNSEDGGGEGRINRGVTGEDEVSGNTYESKYLDLGSCSSGKCRYDTGVTDVTLILKITKKDGSIYQVEDSISL